MQINTILDDRAQEFPEKVYLYAGDSQITYKQLHQRVNRIAASLLELGVEKGDRIALYLRNTPNFIYSWFAINRIGAAIVPINTSLLANETAYILNDSEVKGIIAESDVMESVIFPALEKSPNVKIVISTSEKTLNEEISLSELYENPGGVDYTSYDEDNLVSILYTSGTTGNPKGVMCHHPYYYYLGTALNKSLEVKEDDRLLTCLPLFHMNAQTLATMGSLISNASLILLDGFRASTFWEESNKYDATIFFYLGSILPVLLKQPMTEEEENNQLRIMTGAQASVKKFDEFEKRWNVKLIELYGMTEGGGAINNIKSRKVGSCGKSFINHELKVVDENDNELPSGLIGEIIFKGPSLSLGYWNDEEKTNKSYRNGWMHSEDMGYMDEDGFLFFVDRKKDIIRRSGENISSAEIEGILMTHPAIVEVAAIPVPDDIRDEEIKVFIVLKDKMQSTTPESIITWCEDKLAKFKIPRYIAFRESLPKTETQKIKKSSLIKETEQSIGWDKYDHFKKSENK